MFNLRIGLRDKATKEMVVLNNVPIFDINNGLMNHPVDMNLYDVLFIDRHTGAFDINKTPVYENDIIELNGENYHIAFADGKFYAEGFIDYSMDNPYDIFSEGKINNSKVIGNSNS